MMYYKPMMHYKPTPLQLKFLVYGIQEGGCIIRPPRLTNRANNNVHEKESSSHLGLHAMRHALPTCTFQSSQSLVRLPRFSFALRVVWACVRVSLGTTYDLETTAKLALWLPASTPTLILGYFPRMPDFWSDLFERIFDYRQADRRTELIT